MEEVIEAISKLFVSIGNPAPDRIGKLPQSGSDRIYFRIYAGDETFIATYNLNKKETQTFIYFSRHFENAGLPVPHILGVNEDDTIYIQQDLGTDSLLNKLEEYGHDNRTNCFKKV
jgi:aminoglycoside/choline kinase family phosphotransferase